MVRSGGDSVDRLLLLELKKHDPTTATPTRNTAHSRPNENKMDNETTF